MTEGENPWTDRRIPVGEYVFDLAEQGETSPGAGRPVLLLHGFPQTHRCFDAVAERLLAAAADTGRPLHLLAPDQRGYSPGARPAEISAYAIGELVADVLAILDAAGIGTVDVVGHDWGAAVAWNLAARHPDRVRTLTAVSVPHPAALTAGIAQDPEQKEKSAYIGLFRQPGGNAEDVLLGDGAERLRALYAPLSAEAIAPHFAALSDPAALTPALNWYRAMSAQDSLELPEVSVPVTFLWSNGDVAIGRFAAERCASHVTGPYRFVELDGVSHWIPDQAPDALADAILRQLSEA
ncbi:MAG TPA: alpha/beta hydrolase [Actinocrinis sp.]|nr:alpha/beta hydrolase [Actinocrinis sp.]